MLIVASIISCVAILIVIVYSSLTLNYGEEEELSSAPVHVIHTVSIDIVLITGEHDCLNLQTLLGMTWKQNQTSRVPKLEFEMVPAAGHLFKKICIGLQLSIKLSTENHKTHAGLDRHLIASSCRLLLLQHGWCRWLCELTPSLPGCPSEKQLLESNSSSLEACTLGMRLNTLQLG